MLFPVKADLDNSRYFLRNVVLMSVKSDIHKSKFVQYTFNKIIM